MVYDSHRNRVMMFGGGTGRNDLWSYGQAIEIDIATNQDIYHEGDLFELTLSATSHVPARAQIVFVALDVYGSLWFWPAWIAYPPDIDYKECLIETGESEQSILTFTWPHTTIPASDLAFHAALFDPETGNLTAYDACIWGYES